MQVTVYNNNIEDAIRRFKKKFESSGIGKELRLRESFTDRKKIKKKSAFRRLKKRLKEYERREGNGR